MPATSSHSPRPLLQRVTDLSPPRLLTLSFLLLIAAGTVGFKTLPGLYTGPELSWMDALFTTTSAVCVTGLIVVDTGTHFSLAGQAFLLLLVQLGGLGIITFTSVIIMALRRRLSLTHEGVIRSASDVNPRIDFRELLKHVLIFTAAFELVGAVLLYLFWSPEMGLGGAVWPAIFHSISAFCNAGFSTFSDSLMSQRGEVFPLLIIMALIVLGGLGFVVLEELSSLRVAHPQRRWARLSVHTRLVLCTTAGLLVTGWIFFAFFEWRVTLTDMPVVDRLVNALFMSVTARTAGFNTIDYTHAAVDSNFLTILLMTIGGSPGSTAGGLKTTTFALIGLLAWSRLRGRSHVNLWGRTIPDESLQQATGLFVLVFLALTLAIFMYTALEIDWVDRMRSEHLLPFMFEAVSAFNTVGLSMDVTSTLTVPGRFATIVLMFVGRVGPLMVGAALARRPGVDSRIRYATEDVAIG